MSCPNKRLLDVLVFGLFCVEIIILKIIQMNTPQNKCQAKTTPIITVIDRFVEVAYKQSHVKT